MEISISNRQKRIAIDTPKIRRAAKKILSALGCEASEVSIVIVGDEEMATGRYALKNMHTGAQEKVGREEIEGRVRA